MERETGGILCVHGREGSLPLVDTQAFRRDLFTTADVHRPPRHRHLVHYGVPLGGLHADVWRPNCGIHRTRSVLFVRVGAQHDGHLLRLGKAVRRTPHLVHPIRPSLPLPQHRDEPSSRGAYDSRRPSEAYQRPIRPPPRNQPARASRNHPRVPREVQERNKHLEARGSQRTGEDCRV